jgi:hypothetical protein
MLAIPGGRERTEVEFRELLSSAGFDLEDVVATPAPLSWATRQTHYQFCHKNVVLIAMNQDKKRTNSE